MFDEGRCEVTMTVVGGTKRLSITSRKRKNYSLVCLARLKIQTLFNKTTDLGFFISRRFRTNPLCSIYGSVPFSTPNMPPMR
jgi:hypothetical protein